MAPQTTPILVKTVAQGNTAFDPGSAILKRGGQAELDKAVAVIAKRRVIVASIVLTGYADRLEAEAGLGNLSEDRAKAVAAYLIDKGIEQKVIFWEGKGAEDPVPVTNFCE